MLDQLVESKSNSRENTRRSGFLVVVLVVMVSILLSSVTYSLFAKEFDISDDLSLTTLVAPVPVADEEPPPKPENKPEKQPDVDVRKELIQNIMSSPVKPPDEISTAKNKIKEMRTDRMTKIGANDADTGARVDQGRAGATDSGGTGGISDGTGKAPVGGDDDAPPPPTVKPKPKTISGGAQNGKAIKLVTPGYPAAAKAMHASGTVVVQILIDESGSVVSASASSGHPMLRAPAVAAARATRFTPTTLSGQPVKVSGFITYNFTAQ